LTMLGSPPPLAPPHEGEGEACGKFRAKINLLRRGLVARGRGAGAFDLGNVAHRAA
jgi:hypothetical protein